MSNIVPDFNFNLSISDDFADDNAALKFDLFLMTREIKQITNSLKQVTLLSQAQQRKWVKENQEFLHRFMDGLNSDMSDVFDEMSLDQDVIKETIFCVTELRELVNTLNSLMRGRRRLQS